MTQKKERYAILDILRGFAILNMVVLHGIWDLIYIYNIEIPWLDFDKTFYYQELGRWLFVLLSGFCRPLSRQKISRTLVVLAFSLIITAVTLVVVPDSPIHFGILSLIGTGMLLMPVLDKPLKKVNPYIGFILFVLLFVLTKNVSFGYIGLGHFKAKLPEFLYCNLFTAYLGFPAPDFYSSDYFPLVPWLFLYEAGFFLHHIFKQRDWLKHLSCIRIRWLEWIGRNTLYIYVLHQPIIYGVLYFIFGY